MVVTKRGFYEISSDGEMQYLFHRGQWLAWNSLKRFILVLAGTQSGKTSFGPTWLHREIQLCGPGDYMVVTPTHILSELKLLPEFLWLFEHIYQLGKYKTHPFRHFKLSKEGEIRMFGHVQDTPTNIIFGYAQNPNSLESATAKAIWCDESGQKEFKLASWEALLRRLSLSQGRVLHTTTPYDLGWLKQKLYDVFHAAKRLGAEHPLIDVISFDSTENPAFSQEEFKRAEADLPKWKFDMFYRGRFSRPAGMIYDCFERDRHVIAAKEIPEEWQRFVGVDFGGVNTAAVFLARDPKPIHLGARDRYHYTLYKEYLAGGRTAGEHASAMLEGEPFVRDLYKPVPNWEHRRPIAVGGAKSEDQWRLEFGKGGLAIAVPPVSDVEVGIDRGYALLKNNEVSILAECEKIIAQFETYTRELDENNEPTEKIASKETFHLLDAYRYIASRINTGMNYTPNNVNAIKRGVRKENFY